MTRKIFTDDLSAYELIGEGTVRRCYRVPGQTNCLKFYTDWQIKDPAHPRSLKTRLRLFLTKHLFWFNINMQEWRYYQRLKNRLPSEVMKVFPEQIDPLYSPRYGWGLAESLILNYDGSPVRKVVWELKRMTDAQQIELLFTRMEKLIDQLVEHTVALHDPQNILIQWRSPQDFCLRVVDFEPKTKALIPGLTYIRPYLRRRVKNRCTRYVELLRYCTVHGFGDAEE